MSYFGIPIRNGIGIGLRSYVGLESKAPAWTPSVINTSLWLDANDPNTITLNGTTVSQWADKSGKGINVSQTTAANQPTYSATGFNGKPTVIPDGGDFLVGSNSGGLLRNVSGAQIFIVGEHNGAITGSWYFVATGTGTTRILLQNQTSVRLGIAGRRLDSDSIGSAVAPTSLTAGQQFISMVNMDYANAQASHYLNAAIDLSPTAFQTAGNTSDTASAGFNIFANLGGTGAQPANAKLSEILIINRILSTNDRQKVEGYLAWKWGLQGNLPVGHPYKSFPPTA